MKYYSYDTTDAIHQELSFEVSETDMEKVKLSEADYEEIEKKLKDSKESIRESLSNELENEGFVFPLVTCTLYILLMVYISRVEVIGELSQVVISVFEQREWQSSPERFLGDISRIDDLDKYIEKILILYSYNNTYLQSFNYICGLRLSLKLANIVSNDHEYYKFPTYVKQADTYSAYSDNYGEEKNRQGTWTYNSKTFQGLGGYTQHFININHKQALRNWRTIKPIWMNEKSFVSLAVEMILHNSNLHSTLYYYQVFEKNTAGKINLETGTSGINPDVFSAQNEQFVIVMLLFTVYLLIFVLQFFKAAVKFYKIVKEYLAKWKTRATWHDFLEILLVALTSMILGLFIQLDLGNMNQFTLPLDSERFDRLIEYATEFRVLIRTSSITCLLNIFRLVTLLKSRFPSFSIMFDTIKYSKSDLVNLAVMMCIMFLGFSLCTLLAIGSHEVTFSSLKEALIRLFAMLVGIFGIGKYLQINNGIKNIVLVCFIVIFYFILLKMILAIVMSIYNSVRNRDELLLAGKLETFRRDSIRKFQLVMNLVFFKNPHDLNKAVEEYLELKKQINEDNGDSEREKIIDRFKMMEKMIVKLSKGSIFETFQANLASLNSELRVSTLENKSATMRKMKICIRSLLEKKKLAELKTEKLEKNVNYHFHLIIDMIVYVALLLIFTNLIIYQIDVTQSFGLQDIASKSVYLPSFRSSSILTLGQITSYPEVYDYINQVILPLLDGIVYQNNYLFLDNTIRLTLMFNVFQKNISPYSEKIFPNILTSGQNITSFRGAQSKMLYDYIEAGSRLSFKEQGGAVFTLKNTEQGRALLGIFETDEILNGNCQRLALEWVFYNGNSDAYVYNSLAFSKKYSGAISEEFYSRSIGPEFHSSGKVEYLVLYIVSFIICSYFLIKILKKIIQKWKKANASRLEKLSKSRKTKFIIRTLSEEPPKTSLENLLHLVLVCFKFLYRHFFQLVLVLCKYFLKNKSAMLESISIFLTYTTIIIALKYKRTELLLNKMSDFSIAARGLDSFYFIAALNIFFLFIRLPGFFSLSSRMKFLLNVLNNGKTDILYFLLVFFIFLLGFSISGHLMLGHYHPGYKDIGHALISSTFMKFGVFNFEEYRQADNILGIPFIILYVTFMIFFLFSMLLAITTGHYNSLKKTYKSQTGFFEKIKMIFRLKFQNRAFLSEAHETFNETYLNQIVTLENNNKEEESISFDISTGEKNSANKWLIDVEKNVFSRSGEKIDFSQMRIQTNFSNERNIMNAKSVVYFNKSQWELESLVDKVKIWNTLSAMIKQQLLCNDRNKDFTISTDVDLGVLEEIWGNATDLEKLELWDSGLNNDGRTFMWNLINFPDDLLENWWTLSIAGKIQRTQCLLKKVSKYKNKFQSSPHQLILINSLPIVTKLKFWLCLSSKLESKAILVTNNTNLLQSEITSFLIGLENYSNCFTLENYDSYIESLLDHSFYCKIESASWQLNERQSNEKKLEEISDLKQICESLLNYKYRILDQLKTLNYKIEKNTLN